jgi:hypothetical protein
LYVKVIQLKDMRADSQGDNSKQREIEKFSSNTKEKEA